MNPYRSCYYIPLDCIMGYLVKSNRISMVVIDTLCPQLLAESDSGSASVERLEGLEFRPPLHGDSFHGGE